MRKLLLVASVAFLAVPGVASADLADYLANPGRQQAQSHTPPGCNPGFTAAGQGAFGFYSEKGANQAGGADGRTTGENNAALCGNKNGQKQTGPLAAVFSFFAGLFAF